MNERKTLQRKSARLKVNAVAQLYLNGNSSGELKLRDVCMRGVSGVTSAPLEINKEVELRLDSPFVTVPVKQQARVAWVRQNTDKTMQVGFFINFLDLENFTRHALQPQHELLKENSMFNVGVLEPLAPLVQPEETPVTEEALVSSKAAGKAAKIYQYKKIVAAALCLITIMVYARNLPFMKPVWSSTGLLRAKLSRSLNGLRKHVAGLSIDGVMYDQSGRNSAVTINGQILEEGDSINSITIKKIERDMVIIEKNGKEKKISLIPNSV